MARGRKRQSGHHHIPETCVPALPFTATLGRPSRVELLGRRGWARAGRSHAEFPALPIGRRTRAANMLKLPATCVSGPNAAPPAGDVLSHISVGGIDLFVRRLRWS